MPEPVPTTAHEQYQELLPTLEHMRSTAESTLQQAIARADIPCVVTARVKAEASAAEKLVRKPEYRTFNDLTDLVGLRIITLFADDVDRVASLLSGLFRVDESDIEDKRSDLAATQFGYLSLHYLCRLPDALCEGQDPRAGRLRFEVQIRSALQHVWAEIEHDTGYKVAIECPREWRRSFSRVAGLLELADAEFARIRDGLDRYRHDAGVLIENGLLDEVSIDADTWGTWLKTRPFDALNERIANINGSDVTEANLSGYLAAFDMLGLRTLGDVDRMAHEESDEAYRLAELQLGGTELDILSSSVGLQYLCVARAVRLGMGEPGLRALFVSLGADASRASRRARTMLRLAQTSSKG